MPNPASEKITRRKLSDQVYDRLHAMIVAGELVAGDPLPSERDLMERFGVGRPAVREALQSMHTMGLITINHGERSRVNEVSAGSVLARVDAVAQLLLSAEPRALGHLKEARRLFETGIIRIAAAQATPEDIADLRVIVARQRAQMGQARDFISADMAFHNRIAAITGNPIIEAVSQAMLKWLFHYHSALLHWSGKEDLTLLEHDRIIDLISAHDVEAAVAAMRSHIERSADVIGHHG